RRSAPWRPLPGGQRVDALARHVHALQLGALRGRHPLLRPRTARRSPPAALLMTTIAGSCLCGGVRFEVELPFRRANHCHCEFCRKHSGAFGETQGRVPREQFRLLQGEELLRVFKPEGETAVKALCSVCGSSLFGAYWPEG